jgi:hypothetical protein
MQLNQEKCKEIQICFSNCNLKEVSPLSIEEHQLELVTECTLLGMTISSDLKWNAHVDKIIGKVSKRIYFLVQLKIPCWQRSLFVLGSEVEETSA